MSGDVCDPLACPFAGCASCAYAGGEIPAGTTESRILGGRKTAPGGALTPLVQGPRPSDITGGLPA